MRCEVCARACGPDDAAAPVERICLVCHGPFMDDPACEFQTCPPCTVAMYLTNELRDYANQLHDRKAMS